MREQTLIHSFSIHDAAINNLRNELRAMQKTIDRGYHYNLTHVMMWDVLMELLDKKGIVTKMQFDEALKALSEKTKAAMEAEQKKQAETKVTVLSDVPAIPVVK